MATKQKSQEIETIYFSNGWIEIRNTGQPDDQWIATDKPREIER